MDNDQKEFIREQSFRLMQELVPCSDGLLEFLKGKKLLTFFEIEALKRKRQNEGDSTAAVDLLNVLMRKTGSFPSLIEACEALGYDSALEILNEFGTKPPGLSKSKNSQKAQASTSSSLNSEPSTFISNTHPPSITLQKKISEIKDTWDLTNVDSEVLDFVKSVETLDVVLERPEQPMKDQFQDSYNLPILGKGLALIINIIEFDNETKRSGADRDVEYLNELLVHLGYKVYPERKKIREKERKEKSEIIQLIEDFKDKCENYKPASVIIFIGSHGSYPNQICTSDDHNEPLDLYIDIVSKFFHSECPVLKGKPKIFITQVCQGFVPQRSKRTSTDSFSLRECSMEDAIICMAQSPGGLANRDVYKGAWFVYCFVYIMMKNVKNKSFQEILELIKIMLKKIEGEGVIEQMPMYHNWNLKTLYFPIEHF